MWYLKNTFLWFMGIMLVSMTHAATIHIGPKAQVKSINAALKRAKDGDTLIVNSGLYQEGNISINKSITLLGQNNPVIDGQGKYEPISVRAPYVKIEGFTVKNSGQSSLNDIAGIKIYNTEHVTISKNILDNNFFGVYAQNSKHCVISNNRITAYGVTEQMIGNGVHGWKCDSVQIEQNQITGHRDGVYLEFVTHSSISHNLSIRNLRYGLHFMFSHENGYFYNTFKHNGAGVAVMYTRSVRMEHNIFEENWGDAAYGLLLKDITDSNIESNSFILNTTGVYMEGSNRIQVKKNIFMGNGWAVRMQSNCSDNMLTNNNFIQNTFDLTTNGSLTLNHLVSNYWDKYEGYDLNRNGIGDIPYHPVSLFSVIVEKYPMAMILFRSFMVTLFDRTERALPSLTPENLKDEKPLIKALAL